jgi:hypothetical protein
MSSAGKNYLVGVFSDEDVVMEAVSKIRGKGVKIHEVFTPYPIHNLEHALGYKKTRLPVVAFLFGITGTALALTMQISMMVIDWPMIVGGKPFFAFPDFVPVAFELSVLLAALGMVGTFLVRSDLKPHKKPRIFDVRSTDDKHIMAIDIDQNSGTTEETLSTLLSEVGAEEVNKKVFED